MRKDISPEWPGLTVEILYDIFGAHKALVFGRLQRADYSMTEFMKDLKFAERKNFGGDICTQHLSEDKEPLGLSFYPEYLINDDLFEVMACHYAVSSVVRSMWEKMNNVDALRILSVVMPAAISSRYDVDVRYQQSITTMEQLVKLNPTKSGVLTAFESKLENVSKMAVQIQNMIDHFNADGVISKNIVIVFKRHQRAAEAANTICIFGFDEQSKVEELCRNNFLCFEFNLSRNQVISFDDVGTVARCWMNFGVGQRLRFYPEYAIWIVPYLFVRTTKMTAHQFLERIYGDDYKHGWRLSLDDPTFNKYYHIITRHEHISNNYNRDEVDEKQDGVQRLLRDVLDQKLKWETARKLRKYTKDYAFDSEAILEDMEDVNDSNIVSFGDLDGGESRTVKFAVLKFQNMDCAADSVRDLKDCEHIHILIENLQKFEECELVVDALNVVQFDVDSVITAFDHIIKVHDFLSDADSKLKIQNFVAEHIACLNGEECAVLKAHSQRTREREKVEEKRDEPVHEVDTLCEVTADTLSSVHSYILHHDTHLYRLLSGREKKGASRFSTGVDNEDQAGSVEESKVDIVEGALQSQGINFGVNILQWLQFGEKSLFESVGEEMVQNPDSTIDETIFQQYLMICLAKINGTNYTVNEMVCLKFYTDTNEMQSKLRKAHWTAALLKVRKAYYQWAMGLYRAHLYHDAPVPTAPDAPTKPCRLFHGLNRLFTVSSEMPFYFGPFSTTIAKTVASTFCDERGLIWLIQPSYANPLKLVVGINVDWISGFKHEREVLLYNQCLPIEKTETFDEDSNILMNHFIRSLISRESPIIKKEAFYKQLGIRLDANWMQLICTHDLLFEKTKYNGMRVVDRLVMELGVVEPNLTMKLWNTIRGDKTELEYFVEDLEGIQLLSQHRILTTKFKLLHFSPFLNRTWIRFDGNVDDICFRETDYKTNGESFAATMKSVKGQITRIQVKNSKFFGNRGVNLQTFDDKLDYKNVSDEFVDALTVDKYGFVFIDNIPRMNHQFVIGDNVQFKDGVLGKICEFKSDEICIEIGDDRRWMERSVVPLELTVVFPHQQDIGKYEFTLNSSVQDDIPNNADVKLSTFTDIKKFKIPFDWMRNHQSDVRSFAIYAKPRKTDIPLIKIKSIEYGARNDDELVLPAEVSTESDVESLVNYLMKMLKERDSEIKDEMVFLNSLGLQDDQRSNWMEYITEHPLLFDVTLYRRKLVVERLIVELGLLSPDWVRKISQETMNDKPLLEWLVEDRSILKLLDHYRMITSKFKILHFSPLLNRSWLKLERNSKIKDLEVATSDQAVDENEYKVNGEILNTTTFSVTGKVTKIEVKNSKLFGKDFGTLQTFEEEKDDVPATNAFVDSLSVDQYGFVFADGTPRSDHEFTIGDMVQYKDDSIGNVCDLTADQICIKIGDEKRWIKKSVIALEIALIFCHQKDIGKYEFVLSTGEEEEIANLSVAKKFSFSDIKQIEIPYPSMEYQESNVISIGVYAKPKAIDVPPVMIKSIEYPPSDVAELVISNTESIVNHLIVTLKQNRTEIRDSVAFLNLFGLHLDDRSKWMHLIIDHSMLFDVTAYRKKSVIERLIVELKLLSNEWIREILKQKKQNKPLLEWLVEDRKMLKLLNHYRVMTTKVKIHKRSKLLKCSWLAFEKNTKMEDAFGVKGNTDSLYFEETEYRINGQVVPFSLKTFDGLVQRITVKNPNLFGDDEVILQQRDRMEKFPDTQTYFGDMLSIQRGDVIRVKIDVDRKVKMKQNGSCINGVVSRKRVDEICVKIVNDDFISFQWVTKDDVSNTIKLMPFQDESEISQFDFAARAGLKDDAHNLSGLRRFSFNDVNDFRILVAELAATSSTADVVHIYAKPKAKDLQYHHIKTLHLHFESLSFSRYSLAQKDPFCISEEVKVRLFSESLECGGKFEVETLSNLIISKSGVINASGCGLKKDSRHSNDRTLKYGKYIGDGSKNVVRSLGAGGGIISLRAGDSVVNDGALLCRASDNRIFSGGTVYIVSDGVFENNGFIDGGKNGEVHIFGAGFINTGQITPIPSVVVYKSGGEYGQFWHGVENGKEELIELEVVSNRGHQSACDIKNVLKEGKNSCYICGPEHGPPNEDWFIFQVQSKQRFIPKRIVIMNEYDGEAVKSLAIAGSDDRVGDGFMDWIPLSNIPKRKAKSSERYEFPVDSEAAYFAWKSEFKKFRIDVVENHGGTRNLFYEFKIYGIYCE